MNLNELRARRANLITEARAILDSASETGLAQEDENRWATMIDQAEALRAQIERIERQETLERGLSELEQRRAVPADGEVSSSGLPNLPNGGTTGLAGLTGLRSTSEYRAAFQRFLQGGERALREHELRALQADLDTSGGYLVAPQQFVTELIQAVDNAVVIRGLARKFTLTAAESLGAPALDTDIDDADWTSELATGNEDSALAFGKRELRPHPLAKRIKVSNKLLRAATVGIETLVRERMAYKFGVTEEKVFMTGHGSGQPLGIFTASAQGISTGRDVSTGNTTTSIQTDGLLEAKYTLKGQYRGRARWIFHRDALKQIAKLKDGDGQYIWQQGITAGTPDRLLNLPYLESEYAPNTFTTGLYAGILGDFQHYWIADALDMQMQRLSELYAATNQTGFIGRMEVDGMPVLEEAFIRVKLA